MSDAANPFDGEPGTPSAAGGSWGNSGGSSVATLLPSECPNCGRLHKGHNFNEEPGPIQTENKRLRNMAGAAYTVFWNGGQYVVRGRDREHAKRVLYMSIPEAKWSEIK